MSNLLLLPIAPPSSNVIFTVLVEVGRQDSYLNKRTVINVYKQGQLHNLQLLPINSPPSPLHSTAIFTVLVEFGWQSTGLLLGHFQFAIVNTSEASDAYMQNTTPSQCSMFNVSWESQKAQQKNKNKRTRRYM